MVYYQVMPKKKGVKKTKDAPHDYQDRLQDIVRKGISYKLLTDMYHLSLWVNWYTLVLGICGFYFCAGLVFSAFYFLFSDSFEPSIRSFEDSFFVSMNIFNSQGSGDYVAKGLIAKLGIVIQGLFTTLVGATVTGIIFARFSKPEARIRFADSLLKTTFNGKNVLQFRVANERDNFCYDVTLKFSVFFAEVSTEGMKMRRLHDLALEQQDVVAFGLSVVGHHIIDENSPLYNLSIQDLIDKEAQFIIFFTGTDAVFGQDVQANRVFSPNDIVEKNGHFSDMICFTEDEKKCLDLTKLNNITDY